MQVFPNVSYVVNIHTYTHVALTQNSKTWFVFILHVTFPNHIATEKINKRNMLLVN